MSLRPPALPALALAAALIAQTGTAEALQCRLALALALDISSSVDEHEDALQRGGLAAALSAPDVQAAFMASDLPVALAVYEWSGRYNQETLLDWVLVTSPAVLDRASARIATSQRSYNQFATAMGEALRYGAQLFETAPACLSRTIDMAGDGTNNESLPPSAVYEDAMFDGVVVNGLVVNAAEFEAEITLIDFYEREVLHGPGAFLELANSFDDYERAMRRKLVREVRLPAVGALEPDRHAPPG